MTPDQKENVRQIHRAAKELKVCLEGAKLAGAEPFSIEFALMLLQQAKTYALSSIEFQDNKKHDRQSPNLQVPDLQQTAASVGSGPAPGDAPG